MKLLLLISAILPIVFCAPWDDLSECRPVKKTGFSIPNCGDNVSQCFQQAHNKSYECIRQERNVLKVDTCIRKTDVKKLRTDWFKLSCKWHNALSKCMSGDSAVGYNVDSAITTFRKRRTASSTTGSGFTTETAQACWHEVHAKAERCKALGATCNHFKVCSGEEPDTHTPRDSQAGWYEITRDLKQQKVQTMNEFRRKFSACVKDTHGHAHTGGARRIKKYRGAYRNSFRAPYRKNLHNNYRQHYRQN